MKNTNRASLLVLLLVLLCQYCWTTNNILKTQLLNIVLDEEDGFPLYYELKNTKIEVRNKFTQNTDFKVTMRNKINREFFSLNASFEKHTIGDNCLISTYYINKDGKKICNFSLKYQVSSSSVILSLENVQELDNYLLMDFKIPSLITFYNKDGSEWIAHGDGGGVFSYIKHAQDCILQDNWSDDFSDFPNFTYLPLVMMGNGEINVSMEVLGYLCPTMLKIQGGEHNKYATAGVKGVYRVKGGLKTPDILVNQNELCRLDFTQDYDNNRKIDWLDAAKSVRDKMPKIPTHYFDDKFVWIVSGQAGRSPQPTMKFFDITRLIKKIYYLTDGCPQELYISGWTEGGHDTAYPNVTMLNQKMGGMNGFLNLKKEAVKYYTNVSFDDMYDDHYDNEFSHPFYNEKYIARTKNNELMTFRAWNGIDTCRVVCMDKYMKNGEAGMKRIKYMLNNYQLQNSLLIDGMSWWSIRHDWDPNNPSSAVDNLHAKFKIIDEYKKNNIHIVSEMLRYPFVGKLAYVVDGPQDASWGWNGFGGEPIPLMRLVYSKSIIYGGNGGDGLFRDPRYVLFNNNRRGPWISEQTSNEEITDYYYINFILWEKLHALDILEYKKNGDVVELVLADDWNVIINYAENNGYSVTHKNIKVLEGTNVSCPINNKRIAFYSKAGGKLSYPLPVIEEKSTFRAKAIYDNGYQAFPFEIKNGNIEIIVPPNVPVIFYY